MGEDIPVSGSFVFICPAFSSRNECVWSILFSGWILLFSWGQTDSEAWSHYSIIRWCCVARLLPVWWIAWKSIQIKLALVDGTFSIALKSTSEGGISQEYLKSKKTKLLIQSPDVHRHLGEFGLLELKECADLMFSDGNSKSVSVQ